MIDQQIVWQSEALAAFLCWVLVYVIAAGSDKRFRFSLRQMLIVSTIIAVALGLYFAVYRQLPLHSP
jgi:hypothetical protein